MTFVIVPVIPDTLIVEGYGVATVGRVIVFIVIGVEFEKTTLTASSAKATRCLGTHEKISTNANTEHNRIASFSVPIEVLLNIISP